MNLHAVPSADLLGVGSEGGAQDMFIPQYALPAVRKPQCHLSLRRDDQSTAPNVTLKLGAAPHLGRLGSQVAGGAPSSQRRRTRRVAKGKAAPGEKNSAYEESKAYPHYSVDTLLEYYERVWEDEQKAIEKAESNKG